MDVLPSRAVVFVLILFAVYYYVWTRNVVDHSMEENQTFDDNDMPSLLFGRELAYSNGQLVVGYEGGVNIYEQQDEGWNLVQNIHVDGFDIVVDGNTMAIANSDLGRIWIYVKKEKGSTNKKKTKWVQIQVLKGGTPSGEDYFHGIFFGYSMGLKNGILAVGLVNRGSSETGHVNIYRQDNNRRRFTLEQKIGTYAAYRMTFTRNDTLLVSDSYHVFIYNINTGHNTTKGAADNKLVITKTQQIIDAPRIDVMDMQGDTIVVGGNKMERFGQVWVYRQKGKEEQWKEEKTWVKHSSVDFGNTIAVHNDWLFVGDLSPKPRVHVYKYSSSWGGKWTLQQELSGHGSRYSWFSADIKVLADDLVAIGDFQDHDLFGKVYLFELSQASGTWEPIQEITPSTVAAA